MKINQKVYYTIGFYVLASAIRDTMEYLISDKTDLSIDNYNLKKGQIESELHEGSHFMSFASNNGEIGETLKKQINELYDLVYGPNSRFARIDKDKIVIDRSLSFKVMHLIAQLHFSLKNIMTLYYNDLAKEEPNNEFMDLISNESTYYCCISQLVLSKIMFVDKFKQFNESMKNNGGKENVESNFIYTELSDLAGIHNWIRDNEAKGNEDYNKIDEIVNKGFELTSGKIKPSEGKTIFEDIDLIIKDIYPLLAKVETSFYAKQQAFFIEVNKYQDELRKQNSN